jgi:lysophospholipase L1-like esterase
VKNILCFGDSNTWGYAPVTGLRYPHDVRWTGVLQQSLGTGFRIIEEGLNGRTTIFNEPGRDHRCGLDLLPPLLETHAPLDLVVIMLGTNDLKSCFNQSAEQIARGAKKICQEVLDCEYLAECSTRVVLVSPALVEELPDEDAAELSGAMAKSREFSRHYGAVAEELAINFFDAAEVVETSQLDGVHWDAKQHQVFGRELSRTISKIFL